MMFEMWMEEITGMNRCDRGCVMMDLGVESWRCMWIQDYVLGMC